MNSQNLMETVNKKFQGFKISKHIVKKCDRLHKPHKAGKAERKSEISLASQTGGEGLAQCLKVQPKALERLTPGLSAPCSTLSENYSGLTHCQIFEYPENLGEEAKRASLTDFSLFCPPASPVLVESDPSDSEPPLATTAQTEGQSVDPAFIRTITSAEHVCGEKRYKCSGCLRYHDTLGSLMSHIEQGWREGFSCRVFYLKLKSIWEQSLLTHSQVTSVVSGSDSQLSSLTSLQGEKNKITKQKKTDMIHKWLQNTELPTTSH
ncbi:uncharacterized protein spata46 [Lepisosteus oculatus]